MLSALDRPDVVANRPGELLRCPRENQRTRALRACVGSGVDAAVPWHRWTVRNVDAWARRVIAVGGEAMSVFGARVSTVQLRGR